ncbi:MAG: DegV family protein [Actinobacteria bacterium]|nr:DegV family protein [Actinomycetota bacterium]
MELTAANTAIVLDSTADYPEAHTRFANWRVIPLYVRFGDVSFRDYVDLAPEEFYSRLRAATTLPTTSQPTPQDFLDAYGGLAAYERIYSLHISGKLSGTVESARIAAAELGGDRVRVLDSGTASAALALLALAVQRLLDRGTSDEEVTQLIAAFGREAGLLFTVDTLEYLARGGRIGKAQAFAGQLLHIKPILGIRDGEVVPIKRVRGNNRAFAELIAQFTAATEDGPELRVGIAHADAPERAEALAAMVRRERPQAHIDLLTTLGAVVGAHAGPGTVGFFWFPQKGYPA